MTGTYDEFRGIANHDGDGWGLYRETRGRDFKIEPWQWISEASPYANEEEEPQIVKWGRALVAYNAWAGSVGRPSATANDVERSGAAEILETIFNAVLSWPAWRAPEPPQNIESWTVRDLEEHLATLRAQALGAGWLARHGLMDEVDALIVESTQHIEVALSAELERRGIRS